MICLFGVKVTRLACPWPDFGQMHILVEQQYIHTKLRAIAGFPFVTSLRQWLLSCCNSLCPLWSRMLWPDNFYYRLRISTGKHVHVVCEFSVCNGYFSELRFRQLNDSCFVLVCTAVPDPLLSLLWILCPSPSFTVLLFNVLSALCCPLSSPLPLGLSCSSHISGFLSASASLAVLWFGLGF